MEETQQKKPRSKIFIGLVLGGLILFALLLLTNRQTLTDTYNVLRQVELQYMLLLPVIQVVNYFFIGNYYRTMFGRFGVKISPGRAWGVVAAMNFVNQVLPSGGLSGISYLAYGLRANISSGKTTLVQIGRYIAAFGSYAIMLPIVAILLIQEGNSGAISGLVGNFGDNIVATTTVVLFVLFGLVLALGLRNKSHSHRFTSTVIRFVNMIVRPFRSDKSDLVTQAAVDGAVNEFHDGIDFFKAQKAKAIIPIASMLLSALMEMTIVYVSLRAVSAEVDFSVVFVAFAAANVAGVVSVVPGDVGVHEAVVIAVMSAFDIPIEVALSATLLYRVFNKMLFLPIGFYFYTHFLKPSESQPLHEAVETADESTD